jgi:hypothetical protein
VGSVDEYERGLVVRKNPVVLFDAEPIDRFRWTGKTFVFAVAHGPVLKGSYGVSYAYKEEWQAAQTTASARLGPPVLIMLLSAARNNIIACILAEAKPEEAQDGEDLHVVDFVGIVNIESVGESQVDTLTATKAPPKHGYYAERQRCGWIAEIDDHLTITNILLNPALVGGTKPVRIRPYSCELTLNPGVLALDSSE